MRVLRIIPTIDPDVGGPSNSAVNAAISESRSGVETTLIFTGDDHSQVTTAPARRRLEAAGVRTLMFPRPGQFSDQAGLWGVSAPMLVWVLRHARTYDVIHLHYVWTLSTAAGALIGSATGRRVVLTAHESLTRYDIDTASGSPIKRRLKLAMRRFIMNRVDTVISASDLEERDSLLTGEHGVVISHPVVDRPEAAAAEEPPSPPFTIGYLGRLHPKKNIEVALHALAELPADSRLIVCGDGTPDYRCELRDLAVRLKIDDRVEWRGHVNPAERDAVFATCHVSVMPSRYECFGMAAAEAMAAGIPVIVTESTGVASIVRATESGWVVATGDPAALARALAELSSSSQDQRATMRANALRGATEWLSFDAYGTSIKTVYQQLCESADPHGDQPEVRIDRLTAAR